MNTGKNISSIQIMGDIHSGTRWLWSLLDQNVNQLNIRGRPRTGIKHEYFSKRLPEKDVLYIYPIRVFESWLPKMKVMTYGYWDEKMPNTAVYDKYCNTILSNLKILQDLNFICARLDVLQKDQGCQLLTKISDVFNISVCPDFRPITKHTKSHTQWWKSINKSSQPNYNFDYCNNHSFKSLLNQLESELLFNAL